MISISPRPHPRFQTLEEQQLWREGFVARRRLKRPITFFLVNTGLEEKALRASLSQSWRHKLKRAERNDLEVRVRDASEGLLEFCALHKAMIARKQFKDRAPSEVLPPIIRQLPSSSLIVTALHQGRPVAGAVIILSGDIAYYLYGATADAALPLFAGYALHWRICAWLREHGIGWYDLGDGFGGLRQFKEGLVGKAGALIERADEFDYCASAQARLIGESIYRVRNLGATLRCYKRSLGKRLAALRA